MIISCLKCDLCTFYARVEKHIYKWANHGYSKIKMQCPPCTFQKYIICQNKLLIMKIYWSSAVYNPITRVKQKPFPDLKLTGTGNVMQFPFSSSYLFTGKDRERARETIWCSSCYCYEFTNAQAAWIHIQLPAAGFLSFSSYWPLCLKLVFRINVSPQA